METHRFPTVTLIADFLLKSIFVLIVLILIFQMVPYHASAMYPDSDYIERLPAAASMVTPESAASRTCLINLAGKQAGKPIAGNRHDGFDVAETGNRLTVWLPRNSPRPEPVGYAALGSMGTSS
jgi:hypothetical protein